MKPLASEAERPLLEDGYLTLAEYEGAKLAELACLRERGLTVPDRLVLDGLYRFTYPVSASGAAIATARSAIAECNKAYAMVLDMAWAEITAPLAQETVAKSRAWMATCLASVGLRVEDAPWRSTEPATVELYVGCIRQMQAVFKLGDLAFGVEGDGGGR